MNTCIMDTCIMVTIIMDTSIMDTCIMVTSIMDTIIMDTCIIGSCIKDICIIDFCIIKEEKEVLVNYAGVTRPERPKGAKDDVKEARRATHYIYSPNRWQDISNINIQTTDKQLNWIYMLSIIVCCICALNICEYDIRHSYPPTICKNIRGPIFHGPNLSSTKFPGPPDTHCPVEYM